MSEFQKGIWFAVQLPEQANDYNVSIQLNLKGDVAIDKLELAINKTIQKFAALRTVFKLKDGVPYQYIQKELSIMLIIKQELVMRISQLLFQITTILHSI